MFVCLWSVVEISAANCVFVAHSYYRADVNNPLYNSHCVVISAATVDVPFPAFDCK